MSTDYQSMNDVQLRDAERAIAREHIDKFPWIALFWALANVSCWLGLWVAVFFGELSLWIAFPIATINMLLFYLPSHEAQHSIFARPGDKLRWLNEFVGQISSVPLVIPYRVLRATHMEHHKFTNDPDKDPDYPTHAATALGAIWAAVTARQPRGGQPEAYRKTLERLERTDLLAEAALYELVFYGIMFALAWSGFAIQAALLWWLPRHISMVYLLFYLSWAPHNPELGVGRYADTRSFTSRLGNIGSMGMQYHIVHHLYPRIPLTRTPAAFRQMRPILERLGAPLHD